MKTSESLLPVVCTGGSNSLTSTGARFVLAVSAACHYCQCCAGVPGPLYLDRRPPLAAPVVSPASVTLATRQAATLALAVACRTVAGTTGAVPLAVTVLVPVNRRAPTRSRDGRRDGPTAAATGMVGPPVTAPVVCTATYRYQ